MRFKKSLVIKCHKSGKEANINVCKGGEISSLISSAKYAYTICDRELRLSFDETTTNMCATFSYAIFGCLLPFWPWNVVLNKCHYY